MSRTIKFILALITVVILSPTVFTMWFGTFCNDEDGEWTEKLFFLILALLNSIFVWWMIYEVFIK